MKWYLIDTNDGIIDEAEKKAILMWKYNFTHSSKCGKAYRILKDNSDGIGGNYWIVKEDNLKATGFEWAIKEHRPLSEIKGFDDVGLGVIWCDEGRGTYILCKELRGYDLTNIQIYRYCNPFREMRKTDTIEKDDSQYTYCVKRDDLMKQL